MIILILTLPSSTRLMTQLSNLPDLSRFFDGPKINNTVNLLIGEDTITVNGIVISQASQVLEDLAAKSTDIYLDDFVGDLEGVRDCLRFLYGGKVAMTLDNINTIVKFSIRFDVKCLYAVCLQWIEQNLRSRANLYLCIKIGIMVEGMRKESKEILTACTYCIEHSVAFHLVELSVAEKWLLDDNALIRFLIQPELLRFTLPIFQQLSHDDNHIKMIVEEVESVTKGVSLLKYKKKYCDLMKLLTDRVGDLETCKRINRLSSNIFQVELQEEKSVVSLVSLSKNYLTLSANAIWESEREYNLEHFEYLELLTHWIIHNQPTQAVLTKLWGTIRPLECYAGYINRMRDMLLEMKLPCRKPYSLPVIQNKHAEGSYRYGTTRDSWCITNDNQALPCNLPINSQRVSLLNKGTTDLLLNCKKCKSAFTVKFKVLEDATPCYWSKSQDNSHPVKHHLFTRPWVNANQYSNKRSNYSLITNSYSSLMAMITEPSDNQERKFLILVCLYECANLG